MVGYNGWRQGARGKRYWLHEGVPDLPQNRLYGPKALDAARASQNKLSRGLTAPNRVPTAADPADEAKATYERARKNGVTGELLERLRKRAEGTGKIAVPPAALAVIARAERTGVLDQLERRERGKVRGPMGPAAIEALAACWAVALSRG